MVLLILKSLHIFFVVTWFMALLYTPKLLLYQTEANSMIEPDRSILIKQYKLMVKRLWLMIAWPSAIFAIIFGMGIMHPYFSSAWFWVKMVLVVALFVYHHVIHFAYKNLQKDKYKYSSDQLQMMFETVLVFLVVIIFVAVLKAMINIYLQVFAGVAVIILIFMIVRYFVRKNKKAKASETNL